MSDDIKEFEIAQSETRGVKARVAISRNSVKTICMLVGNEPKFNEGSGSFIMEAKLIKGCLIVISDTIEYKVNDSYEDCVRWWKGDSDV